MLLRAHQPGMEWRGHHGLTQSPRRSRKANNEPPDLQLILQPDSRGTPEPPRTKIDFSERPQTVTSKAREQRNLTRVWLELMSPHGALEPLSGPLIPFFLLFFATFGNPNCVCCTLHLMTVVSRAVLLLALWRLN